MLDYAEVYRVIPTVDGEPEPSEAFVALGCVHLTREVFKPDWVRFCRNHELRPDDGGYVWVTEDGPSLIEVTRVRELVDPQLGWRFEPLTLDLLREMLGEGTMTGISYSEFATDAEIHAFFKTEFLSADWQEWKDSGRFEEDLQAMIALDEAS
jgi:hypothetical protein